MIEVEVFLDHPNNANTYLIKKDGHAVIVDPANNIKTLSKFTEGLVVDAIFLTHGHFDHFKSLFEALEKFNVKCYMHINAKKKIADSNLSYAFAFGTTTLPNIPLEKIELITKEQTIKLKTLDIGVIFTPGHTNCSVMYVIEDMIFSGDTIFKNSVGRTDLATGSMIEQKLSLDKIKKIKTNYKIYPGHDEKTSLYEELKNNRYLK